MEKVTKVLNASSSELRPVGGGADPMWHSYLPFGFCAFRFPQGDGVGLPIHCQGWSQLTQVVGGAEPGQSVYLGGAGTGRDLIASSCFLLECSGGPAGLKVVPGSPYMGGVTEWIRGTMVGATWESLTPKIEECMQWGALECVETCSDEILACSGIYPAQVCPYFCCSA